MSARSSLEENLVGEAVKKIRRWLRARRKGNSLISSPRLAMKFCGGCNPTIEREMVAKGIREAIADEVLWVSQGEEKDFFLIINGCATACADLPEGRRGVPAVVISGDIVYW